MKTDELINMLATNVEPVKGGELRNTFMIALGIGAVAAFFLMLAILGWPAVTLGAEHSSFKVVALVFTLGLAVAGASLLIKSAQPGEPGRKPVILIGLLFFALFAAGFGELIRAQPAGWGEMVFGPHWAACLVCIPLFAIAPFASFVWAFRRGAPTNLTRTGAIAGLVAGALGAAVFAFHHATGSLPFIAFWYGGPILVCAVVGAIFGPRLLRW